MGAAELQSGGRYLDSLEFIPGTIRDWLLISMANMQLHQRFPGENFPNISGEWEGATLAGREHGRGAPRTDSCGSWYI